MYLPLSVRDAEGRGIMLLRVGPSDPSKVKIQTMMKVNFMMLDIMLLEDDQTTICGTVNLMDFDKVTLGHMVQMTPSVAKKMTTCFQVPTTQHVSLRREDQLLASENKNGGWVSIGE